MVSGTPNHVSTANNGGFDITTGGLQSMSDWEADYLCVHKTDS